MSIEPVDAAAIKAFAIEMSRDPKEGLSARDRAMMACIVIPAPIQQWMVDAGAVEPLLDSIEKTILAAEAAAKSEYIEGHNKLAERVGVMDAALRAFADPANWYEAAGCQQWMGKLDARYLAERAVQQTAPGDGK